MSKNRERYRRLKMHVKQGENTETGEKMCYMRDSVVRSTIFNILSLH